jgi:hypothetical protein
MQKVLLSITLALLLALSVVGIQHAVSASAPSGTTLLADGGAATPPSSWHDGGAATPPTGLHDGGAATPPTSF